MGPSGLVRDPNNEFAIYFPVDSCSSSPANNLVDELVNSPLSDVQMSSLSETEEPTSDPSMVAFVVNLRQVSFKDYVI